MKMKNFKKYLLLIATASLLNACNINQGSDDYSFFNKSSSLNTLSSSSSSLSGANQPSSSGGLSSSIGSSSKPSSSSSSNQSASSYSSNESELTSNPQTCDNHIPQEEIVEPATIINKGIKRATCPNCGGFTESYYYDLDEFEFADTTYQYNGEERELLIKGLIPYGTHVEYENNKLTDIGEKTATAKIYDNDNNLLVSKTAKLSIVQKIGMANIKVTTEDGEDPNWKTQSDGTRAYKNMSLSIDNCFDGYQKNNVAGEIKVRGNSTNQESVAKRAFRFKLSSKNNLLGLNNGIKEKSWVVLADFFDQSRFRNESAFIMGNALFNYTPNLYCSDFQHVKLYMNGEDRGVYLLAEQQQAKSKRIPINEAESAEDGTKIGYLVEIDGLVSQKNRIDSSTGLGISEGDPCFQTDSAGKVNNVSISSKPYVVKSDTFSDEQNLFIKKCLTSCTKAFANVCNGTLKVVDENADIQDSPYTTAYETLNSFIDVDSFFRMYLLQEFLKDYDVGWGSFYLYVDFSKNSKVKRLTMSAPWDFDLGEGNKQAGGFGGWGGWGGQSSSSDKDIPSSGISSTKDSFLSSSEYTNGMTTFNPWLYMLSQTDFFNSMFKKYYSSFANSNVYENIINQIAYERVIFADEFNDNHTRYGKGASGATLMQTRQYDNHKDATDYLVKWFGERKEYLDTKYL